MSRLHKNKEYYSENNHTVEKVKAEITAGLDILNAVPNKIISFFGSHKVKKNSPHYQHCKQLAYALGKRGYAVLSGGGPGIMHAANSGATEAKTHSLGMKALLLEGERIHDPIFTAEQYFHFLFVRRFIMSIKSEALVFYPGGYGTLNELFEYAVLMQTGIVDTVPIICINKSYWEGLFEWMHNNPLKEHFLIHDIRDLDLLHFAETTEEVIKLLEEIEITPPVSIIH